MPAAINNLEKSNSYAQSNGFAASGGAAGKSNGYYQNDAGTDTISPTKENHKLKKELGLMDGAGIIWGMIMGAGIFISPKGVLLYAGSPGVALIVWVLSGFISLIGALCYAELGTMMPKSGGDYIYMLAALGPLPAFLFLWVALLIIIPTGNAVLGLTFAHYMLHPLWPNCDPPEWAVRLLAAVVISMLTAINCYNVKWTAKLNDWFAVTKLVAVFVIIIAGAAVYFWGTTDHFTSKIFEGTSSSVGELSLSLYSGLFSYAGWNFLNFVTEELKDPFVNLPRAIWISLPMVTFVYTLANMAYFIVLSKADILGSNAVAVTFGDQVLGWFSWIMPFFVACSMFGALNSAIFAPSRLPLAGARNGHLPKALAFINFDTCTPIPALTFLGILSILMLAIKDVYVLITYLSFVEALGWGSCVAGLLVLRWKEPNVHRPIKVSLLLPITFLLITSTLVGISMFLSPASEIIIALSIVCSGIPVYYLFIWWENKPKWFGRFEQKLDWYTAMIFKGVMVDDQDDPGDKEPEENFLKDQHQTKKL